MEKNWPQKDKLKEKLKLVKGSLAEVLKRPGESPKLSPRSQKAWSQLKTHLGRVHGILEKSNIKPESVPWLTKRMLRASEEELDALEEELLKKKTKPSPKE